ncbi:YaaR family protein [Bacillus sp. FJAT-49736]|uniref:YaaR family protein n=1 Tax=Bacillus sp. FJAT-49736 TaxID=2833582 RepID=UPI001BCA2EF5|nr:YaaR family protein [Bacillus sp. FJAT-49736]MBS4175881.1 YaaR family protein [Bacillus sp. FJAT-49736]
MKIHQDLRVGLEKSRQDAKQVAAGGTKFSAIVQKQEEKLQMDQLNKLLSEIESAGEKLAKSRTFKDLAKYKALVKRFVRETVDFGMNLKQSHTWNQYGEGRKLNIIETIDKQLVELTDEHIKKESSSIDILGKIGEIKGLLINLYT